MGLTRRPHRGGHQAQHGGQIYSIIKSWTLGRNSRHAFGSLRLILTTKPLEIERKLKFN